MPVPGRGEVLVKLEYVGICGSDLHYFHEGRCGSFRVDGDFILGHECAGTVVETGEAVRQLKAGDRVALEPGIPCGKCAFCKSGRYNLCPEVAFLATPPVQGAFSSYLVFPEDMCFALPEQVSTKEGAMVEPLCVGLHAAAQGNVRLGDRVIILGAVVSASFPCSPVKRQVRRTLRSWMFCPTGLNAPCILARPIRSLQSREKM